MALPFGAHVPFSAHNPSPLSFGFGLGVPQHHLPPPPPTFSDIRQFTPATPSTSSVGQAHPSTRPLLSETPQRTSEKRRRNDELEDDAAMERSPSPADRPVRKLGVKKLKQTPLVKGHSAASLDGKAGPEDDVDLGSLLASLPPSSLLPLLTSLVERKPDLKPIILSLIPRPTLETAIHALNEGAKRLREAYPYSHSGTSAGFGFGGVASIGQQQQHGAPGMRESYIRTRLRQPVREFTKLLLSYMSYFSSTPTTATVDSTTNNATGSTAGTSELVSSQKQQPVVPLHPAETFTFLHALTLQLLRLPPLTLAEFARPSENVVFPRLQAEWASWIQKIDDDVNKWGGMYRDEVVKGWERGLDELLVAEENAVQQQREPNVVGPSGYLGMKAARNKWLQQVGWLIGRRAGSVGMEM